MESTYLIFGAIALILFLVISYFWYRFVFSMKRQLWNQRMIVFLLARLAQKDNAIDHDTAEGIIRKLSVADEHLT